MCIPVMNTMPCKDQTLEKRLVCGKMYRQVDRLGNIKVHYNDCMQYHWWENQFCKLPFSHIAFIHINFQKDTLKDAKTEQSHIHNMTNWIWH